MPLSRSSLKKKLVSSLSEAGASNTLLVDYEAVAASIGARFQKKSPASQILLVPSMAQAERLHHECRCWYDLLGIDGPVHFVPDYESSRKQQFIPEFESERSRIMHLTGREPALFVASVNALLSPTPSPAAFRGHFLQLQCGNSDWPPQKLAEWLVDLDFDNEAEVHAPGEFSWRGGILDIYSPVYDQPLRLEYFGDEIDSIRLFDPNSQRSTEERDDCLIIPRGESRLRERDDQYHCLVDFFDASVEILLLEPEDLVDQLARHGTDSQLQRYDEICDGRFHLKVLKSPSSADADGIPLPVHPLESFFQALNPDIAENQSELQKQMLQSSLKRWVEDKFQIIAACSSDSKLDRFKAILDEDEILQQADVSYEKSAIQYGLLFPAEKLLVLSENDIFGLQHRSGKSRQRHHFQADYMFHDRGELHAGEFAVHAGYGICRYQGIQMQVFQGQMQEVLVLEFADEVSVHLPLSQAYMVSRYVGAGKKLPRLSRIGGNSWKTAKNKAELAVKDLAIELLRLQAVRETCEGTRYDGDEESLDAFADAFPYEETIDQHEAIEAVYKDMAAARPMDRLICGDVGFGKTEVAMRAAYRAVLSGKQVAVLVPTTILCQQHLISFRERFREFPVIIDSLSRFRSAKEQRETVQKLEEGKVDIVIGTHRLVSEDIHFRDLGLMIIDEEQRFGVTHKEKLKRMRLNVDVLTMTATPIPRTLYLSMAGLRDMSTIMTAPQERLPVQTIVAQFDPELIREAVLREMQREGQTFILHNRVKTINNFCQEMRKLIPEARFAIGHGQMDEHELEEVMLKFLAGDIDVLVSTTIIESGLDIPNANTIIIDRADRFGLADLYQLRGRVGRYHRQAYAYMLIPQDHVLLDNAKKRLTAIRKFSQLGAGFKLAMRDLEIRGSGNILGKEQSGYISAIGFGLYCQLLQKAVAQIKGEEGHSQDLNIVCDFITLGETDDPEKISACLPVSYIPDDAIRVECYRQISLLASLKAVKDYAAELQDRFGPRPEAVDNLLTLTRLKLYCAKAGIHALSIRDRRVLMEDRDGLVRLRGKVPELQTDAPKARLKELSNLLKELG